MARRPHILFICSWYPHRGAPALGNFIRRHAQAAALHNDVSVVYAVSSGDVIDGEFGIDMHEEEHLTECIVYFPKQQRNIPLLAAFRRLKNYRKAISYAIQQATAQYGKPDLIHLHVVWPGVLAALPLKKKWNVPLLITEHWSGYLSEDGNYKGALLKSYTQQAFAAAAHVTVVSDRMKKAMETHGLKNNFSMLRNVVDTELFSYKPKMAETVKLSLLHVSMLVEREKNISGMLRVMATLQDETGITLQLVGDGPERKSHEALAAQLGLLDKTVFFTGYADSSAVAAAMHDADALLMFSHFEGMPVTIIEAQACGLPVIATQTGSIPEMVNAQQGIVVPCGDEQALAAAIRTMHRNKAAFSREAIRSHAENYYSFNAIAAQLDKLYRQLLPAS